MGMTGTPFSTKLELGSRIPETMNDVKGDTCRISYGPPPSCLAEGRHARDGVTAGTPPLRSAAVTILA